MLVNKDGSLDGDGEVTINRFGRGGKELICDDVGVVKSGDGEQCCSWTR
jgi:hypothetical protein